MECIDTRLSSFSQARALQPSLSASQSRRAPKTISWPHGESELFNPTSLSNAGFYYDPSAAAPDNCSCFLCGKSLGGWETGDDPAHEHVRHDTLDCGWARSVCEVEIYERVGEDTFIFHTAARLPTSRTLEKARHATFSTWWPHDKNPKHTANSRKMAKAGFYYAPASYSTDAVTCAYCRLSLSDWESGDDPMAEHKRKKPNCAFFLTGDRVGVEIQPGPVDEHVGPPASQPQHKRANGSSQPTKSSLYPSLSQPLPSSKPSDQPIRSQSNRNLKRAVVAEVIPPVPPLPKQRTARATSVTKKPPSQQVGPSQSEDIDAPVNGKGKSRKGKASRATADEALTMPVEADRTVTQVTQADGDEEPPVPKTRGRQKKTKEVVEEPDLEPPLLKRSTRAKQLPPSLPSQQSLASESELEAGTQPKRRGRPRKEKPEVEIPDQCEEVAELGPEPAKPKARGRSKKAKESQAVPIDDAVDMEPEPEVTPLARSTRSRQPPPPELDDPAEVPKTRTRRAASKQPAASASDPEVDVPKTKGRGRSKKIQDQAEEVSSAEVAAAMMEVEYGPVRKSKRAASKKPTITVSASEPELSQLSSAEESLAVLPRSVTQVDDLALSDMQFSDGATVKKAAKVKKGRGKKKAPIPVDEVAIPEPPLSQPGGPISRAPAVKDQSEEVYQAEPDLQTEEITWMNGKEARQGKVAEEQPIVNGQKDAVLPKPSAQVPVPTEPVDDAMDGVLESDSHEEEEVDQSLEAQEAEAAMEEDGTGDEDLDHPVPIPRPSTPPRFGLPASLPMPQLPPIPPLPPLGSFTEAELSMTVEEWVRQETRRQYEVLRAQGERRIAEFMEKAQVVRGKIEAL